VATRSGRNLNGRLDPVGINAVQRLCEYHEKRGRVEIARLGYAQILDQTVPLISVSDEERRTGILASEKIELADELFAKYGVLQLDNVWNPTDIQSCNEQYLDDYQNYFGSNRPDDCLAIGDQRFQITIELISP